MDLQRALTDILRTRISVRITQVIAGENKQNENQSLTGLEAAQSDRILKAAQSDNQAVDNSNETTILCDIEFSRYYHNNFDHFVYEPSSNNDAETETVWIKLAPVYKQLLAAAPAVRMDSELLRRLSAVEKRVYELTKMFSASEQITSSENVPRLGYKEFCELMPIKPWKSEMGVETQIKRITNKLIYLGCLKQCETIKINFENDDYQINFYF